MYLFNLNIHCINIYHPITPQTNTLDFVLTSWDTAMCVPCYIIADDRLDIPMNNCCVESASPIIGIVLGHCFGHINNVSLNIVKFYSHYQITS